VCVCVLGVLPLSLLSCRERAPSRKLSRRKRVKKNGSIGIWAPKQKCKPHTRFSCSLAISGRRVYVSVRTRFCYAGDVFLFMRAEKWLLRCEFPSPMKLALPLLPAEYLIRVQSTCFQDWRRAARLFWFQEFENKLRVSKIQNCYFFKFDFNNFIKFTNLSGKHEGGSKVIDLHILIWIIILYFWIKTYRIIQIIIVVVQCYFDKIST